MRRSSTPRATIALFAATVLALSLGMGAAAAKTGDSPRSESQGATSKKPDGSVTIQSATGTQAVGTFSYSFNGVTIPVPTGCFLTHVISGSGRQINKQYAGVDCIGLAATNNALFCNYRFDYVYKNAATGLEYRRTRGTTFNACKTQIPIYNNPGVPYTATFFGPACVEFFVNGTKRATQCHSLS